MPKRRSGTPSRKSRRRGRPPIRPPLSQVAPQPMAAPAEATAAPAVVERRRIERVGEASVTRFTARDYSYVTRELRRIAVLAVGVIVLLVVLSFFFP